MNDRHPPSISQGFKALLDDHREVSTYQGFQASHLGTLHADLEIRTTYDKKTHLFSISFSS